jgi:lipopolysaccharide biosynthesis regulator YciM
LAHYKTERGKELMAAGQLEQAEDSLNQAISVDKGCLDAYLHLGDLELARGRHRKALNIWRKAVRLEPKHAHLVIRRVTQAEGELGEKAVASFLEEIDPQEAEDTALMALAQHYHRHGDDDKAQELLRLAVAQNPRQLGAHRLLGETLLARGQREEALASYSELLEQIDGDWASYQCEQCGYVSPQLTWKCPRCHAWDSMSPRRA